jgi:hypothetical protein
MLTYADKRSAQSQGLRSALHFGCTCYYSFLLHVLLKLLKHVIHLLSTSLAHATKALHTPPDRFGTSGSEQSAYLSTPSVLPVVGEREIMHRQKISGVGRASEQQEARLKGQEQLQARARANRQQQLSQQQDRMKSAAEAEFISAVQAELGLVTTRPVVQAPSIHSRQQKQQHAISAEEGSIQRHEFIKDLAVFQTRLESYHLPKGFPRPGTTRQIVLPRSTSR